jgi:hypothetical protein
MAPDDRAGLTASDVHRWLRGLQWFHAARFAVMAAVLGATIVSVNASPQCTPEIPCGPSPQGTWWQALFLASFVLLIGAPGLGCLSALTLGILGILGAGGGNYPTSISRGWWAAEAALSAAALVFLLLIRVHQHEVAAAIERPITLPRGRPATSATRDRQNLATDPTVLDSWKNLRALFIGVVAIAGIVLMIIYQNQASASNEHLRHAVRTTAVVQDVKVIDSTASRVDLYLPDTDQVVTVELDAMDDYRIDQTVPVMVDSTGSEPWLRLVAEPDDQTPWLSFAILALLLAAAATLRPARVWWAHRRPLDGNLRGILVSTRWPDPVYNAQISAADGSGLRLSVLRLPVLRARFSNERAIAERVKEWTPPELAVLSGQLWYGGVVWLCALDGETLADAIIGLPQLTLLRSWHAPPPAATGGNVL